MEGREEKHYQGMKETSLLSKELLRRSNDQPPMFVFIVIKQKKKSSIEKVFLITLYILLHCFPAYSLRKKHTVSRASVSWRHQPNVDLFLGRLYTCKCQGGRLLGTDPRISATGGSNARLGLLHSNEHRDFFSAQSKIHCVSVRTSVPSCRFLKHICINCIHSNEHRT